MSDGNDDAASRDGELDYVTLRPDQAVGRYRIVSVLGQGGFGITYRAADSELGREVALKEYMPAALAIRQDGTTVVPRSTAAAQDFTWGRDRFIAEGRTLAALHRVPGVVLVHDFLVANGTAYLVMELLAGSTLQERIQRQGPLDAAAVTRILWTLLDGLEQVHNGGFLHRDIKPANVLIDATGSPTLIDFGASRAALAGRSTALTAIFTPGYAAVEQMTSAKQGPWTDIYGLSATLYHAITGKVPPTAFDRMLDDAYEPLARLKPPGFSRGLLAGLDAGLAVRASDRPQSIGGWRPILRQVAGAEGEITTVAMGHALETQRPVAAQASPPTPPARPASHRRAVWIGAATAILAVIAGAFYALVDDHRAPSNSMAGAPSEKAGERATLAVEAQRLKEQEELARLRAEAAAREKVEQEAAQRHQIEEDTRRKVEAEMAEKQRQQEVARQKAEAEAAAQKQAEEEAAKKDMAEAAQQKAEADRKAAEAAEAALGLTPVDRERIQLALAAVGFPPGVSHGVFGPATREMIAAWQRKTGRTATGYLTADAQRELLRDASSLPEQPSAAKGAPPPVQDQASAAKGAAHCNGSFSSQMCRGAFQGFPPSCWQVPITIRNGAIAGSWTARGTTEPQTLNGSIGPGGEVQITYVGLGTQTYVNQRFTVALTGRLADGILTAAGRGGTNGRDFSIRVQCR